MVSGQPASIDELLRVAERAGVEARRLPVPKAFHCELMRSSADKLRGALDGLTLKAPTLRFLSSVGAREIADEKELSQVLLGQFTIPVNFVAQIEAAYAAGFRRFVEVGPGRVLTKLATRILAPRPAVVVSLDDRKAPGIEAVERALTMLRAHDVGGNGQGRVDCYGPLPSTEAAPPAVQGEVSPGHVQYFDVTRNRRPDVELRSSQRARRGPSADATATKDPVGIHPRGADSPTGRGREIEAKIVELVCEESGYPLDLVEPGADLEGDLGIDTVKQAQILGQVREIYDLPADDSLALRDVPTIQLLARHVESMLDAEASGRTESGGGDTAARDTDPDGDTDGASLVNAGSPDRIRSVAGTGEAASIAVAADECKESLRTDEAGRIDGGLPQPVSSSRYVIRLRRDPLPEDPRESYRPEKVFVIGQCDRADALQRRIASRGCQVERLDPRRPRSELVARLEQLPMPRRPTDVCVVCPGERASAACESFSEMLRDWSGTGRPFLESTFALLQAWARSLDERQRPTLSAVTALGGGMGHTNIAQGAFSGGGIAGLLKDLRRELRGCRVKILDTDAATKPEEVATALLRELDSDDPTAEVGLLRASYSVTSRERLPVPLTRGWDVSK